MQNQTGDLETPDLDIRVAQAEHALNEARANKSAAAAAAAEVLRLADPFEVAIDAAEAALTETRERSLASVKAASVANAALSKAATAIRAFAEAVAAGDGPDDQAIMDAIAAQRDADGRYAFYSEAQSIAQTNVERAIQYAASQRDARRKRNLVAAQERLNADFYALVPSQPDDVTLKAELAKNPSLLASLIKEAGDAYRAAYGHWAGNAGSPIQTPRQRVIQERQDLGQWMAWATRVEDDWPAGWQDRAIIRQVRACIAARDHFTAYTKLGFDDLRRLHFEDYSAARAKLPRWNNFTAPGTNEPMIAPGVFAKVA